jgi:hypothetical protein
MNQSQTLWALPYAWVILAAAVCTNDAVGQQATGPAFPQMQKIWDTPAPPPVQPLADASLEEAFRRAEQHGRLANEMLFRSRKVVDGWLAHADPGTGLLPRRIVLSRSPTDLTIWNAKDCAADLYPFLTLTCALTDRDMFHGRMSDILQTEIRLTNRIGRMPDTYSFTKQGFDAETPDLDSIIFGSSEYIKDGLMPLTEWLGPSPWRARMIGILDDVWAHARVDTPFGKIVSTNFEVNGEMLQVLSRVYWMTGDERYLAWAIRLGDYYLLGDQHPTRVPQQLSLDDHGCEAIAGLCELYATVHFAKPEKKRAYQQPLHEMLDTILEKGRTEHGVFYDWFHTQTGKHAKTLTDNWGYNLNGFYTVYLVDKTPEYREAVVNALSNLSEHYLDYKWERGGADGYADSVEGAINLYNRERIPSVLPWIEDGIRKMWAKQRADGVVEGWYGDGNAARTAIMYALMKTQGVTMQPWTSQLRYGAVEDNGAIHISLYVGGDQPWSGRLVFDAPRHNSAMRLPLDWPRINQIPEWFTARPDKTYEIKSNNDGTVTDHSGKALQAGIPVSLQPNKETRMTVRLK